MRTLAVGLALAGLVGTGQLTQAQDYPTRPVMMIVPHAAGGGTDIIARIVAERMRDPLGQPVVVENIPTAAGTVGVHRVARAAPDGYTIAAGDQTSFVISSITNAVHYDVLQDFEPVALLSTSPVALVTKSAIGRSLRELIAQLRANAGTVSAGTFGKGSGPHILATAFEKLTGTRLQTVSYRGVAPALQDLIAGRLDLMFVEVSGMLSHLRAGQLKAYAVLAENRLAVAPEIPTIEEAGGPPLHITTWRGLWAPRGTPTDVVAKLNRSVVAALSNATLQKRAADLGQEIAPPHQQTSQALAAHHIAEMKKWLPMIQAASARAE